MRLAALLSSAVLVFGVAGSASPKAAQKASPGKAVAKVTVQRLSPEALVDAGIDAALVGKDALAKKALLRAVATAKNPDTKSRALLNLARVQYQDNELAQALENYNAIPKTSPLWNTALEERSWTQLRLGHPEKTIASLKTLLIPQFASQVGSEPYFLQALSQLKICDYTGVFKTIDDFKKRMTPQVHSLQAKAAAGDNGAKNQVADLSETVSKLQLVEVEAVQHVYVTDANKAKRQTISKIDASGGRLTFPDSDEIWLDELDSYQMQAKGCPLVGGLGK